jgi:hypothetical protein
MKTRLIFLLLLIACYSCGTNNKPVSDAQKVKIKGEVKAVVDTIFKGCEEANFEAAIEPFLDSPDFVYTYNGNSFDYKQFVDAIKPVFSTIINQKVTITDEKFAVLDNSTVLYTNNCKWLQNFKDGHAILIDPDAMLYIFKKIENRWKFIYGVESYAEMNVPSESSKGLNQAELLKKFVGNWEIPAGKDTTQFLTMKSLQGEKGLSVYSKWSTKGKMLFEGTGFWAYNAENNKIDNSFFHSSGYVFHDIGEFTSPNTFEFTDVNHATVTKFKLEIISANEIKGTTLVGNKTLTVVWKRVKN